MSSPGKFFARRFAPLGLFFGLALAARAAVVLLRFSNQLDFADERMYLRLADVVGSGQWLGARSGEGILVAPGPVYFWGILRGLGFGLLPIRLVHSVLGALAVVMAFLIGRRIFGPVPAALAATIMAFYPYLLFLAGLLYPQSGFHLALLVVIYALLRWIDGGSWRWIAAGGVALGVAALFVVPILSAAPIFALWLLLARRDTLRARFAMALLLGAATLVTILPATARNYAVAHRFILIADMGGSAFYWANNDAADPYMRDAERWLDLYQRRHDRELARQGWNEAEMRRLLSLRARRFWREQTGRAIHNYLVRLSMFFDVAPRSYTANAHTMDRRNDILAIVSSLPVLLLAPVGVWFSRSRWRLWLPILAVPLFQAVTYAFFHVSVRYRIPFESCFILFAAAGFCGIVLPELLNQGDEGRARAA